MLSKAAVALSLAVSVVALIVSTIAITRPAPVAVVVSKSAKADDQPKEQPATPEPVPFEGRSHTKTTLDELVAAHDQDRSDTDKRYKGQFFELAGQVISAGQANGYTRVALLWRIGGVVACDFAATDGAGTPKKGDRVRVSGRFDGRIGGDEFPFLRFADCHLIGPAANVPDFLANAASAEPTEPHAPLASRKHVETVDASALSNQYNDNPFAVIERLKGKYLKIGGRIAKIGTAELGAKGEVLLETKSDRFINYRVRCVFLKEQVSSLAKLRPGQMVDVSGLWAASDKPREWIELQDCILCEP